MKNLRFIAIFFLSLLVSCSAPTGKNELVTTIFPFKVILQEVVGNRFEIKAILPAGADPHTYEMLPSDFQSIQNAKVFFYGSNSLDGWASKIDIKNKVEMLSLVPKNYLIDIKVYNIGNHEEHLGTDPHFWTDPVTVKAMLPNILNELIKVDPAGKDEYQSNAKLFSEKLDSLDLIIKQNLKNIRYKNIFTSHPFYNYFFERYGFNVLGSIEIAPGSQPTPKDLKNLIDLVDKENVKAIFINRQDSNKSAKVLAESAGIKDFTLDPIGGNQGNTTYEEIILNNLEIIKQALK